MTHFLQKAIADIKSNRFLNLITVITIALSILVVSVFLLFFENASRMIESWNQGGRVMIYLTDDFSRDQLPVLEGQLRTMASIETMVFIPKAEALERIETFAQHLKEALPSDSPYVPAIEKIEEESRKRV